jgi:hypothetical protein
MIEKVKSKFIGQILVVIFLFILIQRIFIPITPIWVDVVALIFIVAFFFLTKEKGKDES